ncbi:MAG: hypothetical protein HKM04_05550 [Legionellales bacterium]|nr:hypothetical protein [Legionellales bacterium]
MRKRSQLFTQTQQKLPPNPANYKTRFGLYNATIRAIECPHSVSKAWWLHNAKEMAKENFPDMYEQLVQLIHCPNYRFTIKDLNIIVD